MLSIQVFSSSAGTHAVALIFLPRMPGAFIVEKGIFRRVVLGPAGHQVSEAGVACMQEALVHRIDVAFEALHEVALE
jgi:hypothetical protein